MSYKSVLIALLAASTVFASCACAAPKKKEAADKQAILITAFGTSMPSARKAIDNLVNAAKKAFPGADVRLAFTSNIIRRKLTREGKKNVPPTPVQALAALNDEGFKNVCVMPTHIIPGAEYDEIKNVVEAWGSLKGKYGIKDFRLGKTCLSSVEGCDEMADILIKRGDASFKVLECDAKWFGVTYKEDRPFVVSKIGELIDKGLYPRNLWAR